MGIFRKLWKGVKKVFKKIGKGIKKVVGKVGKFMDKIGIVGQIALMIILPGIGNAMMKGMAWATKMGATMTASQYAIVRGAGAVLNTALKFATTAGNVYRTVTGAVTDFIGTAGKYIGGKLKLEGYADMTLGQAWDTYSGEVMKNISSVIDPWKQAVTINPTFGSTVADQAKAVGMSPEQFVQNYTMPENVTASLEGLSGKELANFRFDSVQEQIFKPGQGPGAAVTASVITPITEPFQAVRNTDFWGFAPEVVPPTGAWITDPENTGRLIQTGQGEGVTKGIIPGVDPVKVEVESTGLMGPPIPPHKDPTFEGPTRDPSFVPSATQASVTALPDQEELSLYDEYLRPVPQQVATAVGTQLIMGEIMGEEPIPKQEKITYGGTDYFVPSDPSVAFNIISQPLAQAGPTPWAGSPFLNGTNIDSTGSINGFLDHQQRMARYGV